MKKPYLSIFYLSSFLIYSLNAMAPEQNHRIQQGIRSLNIRQVRAVLQELNNNLNQAEYQQLRNIMDSLPQRNHISICQEAGEKCGAALIASGFCGGFAALFYTMMNPRNKENIEDFMDKIGHYVPKSLVYICGTAAAGLGIVTLYYLGKNIKFYLSGKKFNEISNLLARTQ